MAPVEDCYRPDLVPADDELRTEHAWLATELSRAGVDTVLVETMNTAREARTALSAVRETGSRAWVSFACTAGARLLSGEPLAEAAKAVEADGAAMVLVNCTSPAHTEECLRVLAGTCAGPIGAYPNLEDRDGTPAGARTPEAFGDLAARWRDDYGLALVGGCCGSTPEHIAAMTASLA
jgi:S-methylmethionine-dependent homocysteine/selenocysteine methylase